MEMSRFEAEASQLRSFYRTQVLPRYENSLGRNRVSKQWVRVKAHNELVSKLDERLEAVHARYLKRRYPNHRILGEESQNQEQLKLDESAWIIDPIDGTLNYLVGINAYGSMCARIENGVVELACIFLPIKEMLKSTGLLVAGRGCGAWEYGDDPQSLHVSQTAVLRDALVMFEGPSRVMMQSPFVRALQVLGRSRSIGSCAAAGYALASGAGRPASTDALIAIGSRPWDTLPVALMIEEAGGRVTDLSGRPWSIEHYDSLIFSNGHIHEELVELSERVRWAGGF